ncbi:MAG: HPr family phosphocarrier protein [Lentisphaeria bacterium]|nr:HPr family phosphocarrier protein [Lentisphaeria bacterium]
MKERLITIRNKAGIHCRPSSEILNAIKQHFPFHSVEVTAGGETVGIEDSILSLISLGLSCGTSAVLRIEGPDEDAAIVQIGDLFEKEFDFPPR